MEKLKEYIQQIRGVSYKPSDSLDILKEGYIPLLRANNINNGKINFENLIYVKKEKVKDIQYLKKGDILICTSSGSKELVGKAGIIKEDIVATFGAFCKVIRLKECCNYNYFNHYFQSNYYKNMIQKSSNGANINNLKTENFNNLSVNLLSYEDQTNIANKLDKTQEIIDIRKKQIEDLDEIIKSQFVKMFKDKNFEKKEIRELVDRNIIKAKKKFSNGEKIKYIDISSIDNTKNQVIGFNEFEMGKEPSRAQQCLEKNDILISTVRPNLKNVAVNRYDDNNIVGTSGFCVLRPIKCLQEYLLYIVLSEEFTSDMISKTTGANYPAISNNDVLNYKIELPPLELQNQFAEFVKLIDKQKFELQKSLKEIEKLQESLMNKYFG